MNIVVLSLTIYLNSFIVKIISFIIENTSQQSLIIFYIFKKKQSKTIAEMFFFGVKYERREIHHCKCFFSSKSIHVGRYIRLKILFCTVHSEWNCLSCNPGSIRKYIWYGRARYLFSDESLCNLRASFFSMGQSSFESLLNWQQYRLHITGFLRIFQDYI